LAIQQIHRIADGIPRQINTLCDRALLAAYVRRDRQVTEQDVQTAFSELKTLIGNSAIVQSTEVA
jgi:general secretion pathway protein A